MQLAQTYASVRWAPTCGDSPSLVAYQGQRAVLYRRRREEYRAPKREGMQEDEVRGWSARRKGPAGDQGNADEQVEMSVNSCHVIKYIHGRSGAANGRAGGRGHRVHDVQGGGKTMLVLVEARRPSPHISTCGRRSFLLRWLAVLQQRAQFFLNSMCTASATNRGPTNAVSTVLSARHRLPLLP
jgi:hypothetical protein